MKTSQSNKKDWRVQSPASGNPGSCLKPPQFFPGSRVPSRRGRQGAQGQKRSELPVGHLQAGLFQVLRDRERPETCELERESSSLLLEKQKSNVCYHWHVQIPEPVDSRPWNPFLSCSSGLAGKLTSLQLSTRLGTYQKLSKFLKNQTGLSTLNPAEILSNSVVSS